MLWAVEYVPQKCRVSNVVSSKQFELLAPGGDLESIKAAIVAGADAIYCGLDRFNARNRAENLTLDNLHDVIEVAHQHDCEIFLTLNIVLLENEIPAMTRLLRQLLRSDVDGVIIQDLGLAYILKHHFPELDVHASTQLNTHNEGQIDFMKQLGVSRVNLSRELNIDEIKRLAQYGLERDVLMEVFVHGSYCIGFSGLCYISSANNGASGNRGRCSQPCRDQYQQTEMGSDYPLNMKDNSAFSDLNALADAGVYSLKIEGRIKKAHYVYTVVDNWRKQIDAYCSDQPLNTDTTELYTVFNRDFSNGYLKGEISQDMFINNPRDHSATHFTQVYNATQAEDIQKVKQALYDKKTDIIQNVEAKTRELIAENSQKRVTSLKGGGVNDIPELGKNSEYHGFPRLSVLISTLEEADKLAGEDVDIFFHMPSAMARSFDDLVTTFSAHPNLVPYFPAVLIDKDYDAVVDFIRQVKPKLIVSNNTGIGYLAAKQKIDWIAGPQLNITNSYAIKCFFEEFGCKGAFISNEINKIQMQRLVRPEGFQLLYSLYHPNALLTSRQCLFQQTIGCKKVKINKGCLPRCEKQTSIINLKQSAFVLDKQKGQYNVLYGQHHYFNPAVISELPKRYSHYMVDIRSVKTQTAINTDTVNLVQAFKGLLKHSDEALGRLEQFLGETDNKQYLKGL